MKENSDSSAQVQEDLARLEAKLETVQGKLEEKTKQSVEKDQKIKQVCIHTHVAQHYGQYDSVCTFILCTLPSMSTCVHKHTQYINMYCMYTYVCLLTEQLRKQLDEQKAKIGFHIMYIAKYVDMCTQTHTVHKYVLYVYLRVSVD